MIFHQGRRNDFFPVKHEKFPLSYIQDAKNFSVVKPLNSSEAVASLASPVPPPLQNTLEVYNVIISIDPKKNSKGKGK